MGHAVIGATLQGLRATSARINIPAWGCWYAEAQLDGEHTLSGSVTLKIADGTYVGTILSGGAALGRSSYRIVGGAGGWGRSVPAKAYVNDGGVKVSTVAGDAAREAGETIGTIAQSLRLGPSFVRHVGPASRVLELVAPRAWYVDEAGVTRLGARAAGVLVGKATRISPVDRARSKLVLAAESIATLLPGVVVDGLTAVDVLHEVSAEKGLRSTLWGQAGSGTLDGLSELLAQLDPDRAYRGVTEYRVDTISGSRLNLQSVRVSSGMPDLKLVPVWPGVAGCEAEVTLGTRVLVGFIDSDSARPYVCGFEDADSERFAPTTLTMLAGGQVGGEHVMTTEATALLIYNVLVALMAAAGGGPLVAAVLQPLLGAAISAALTAQIVPAPASSAAQAAAAAILQAGFATGVAPSPAMFAAWKTTISGMSSKTANASGYYPSLGAAAVETG